MRPSRIPQGLPFSTTGPPLVQTADGVTLMLELYSSVAVGLGPDLPEVDNPEVAVPLPAIVYLAVPSVAGVVVQDDPSHCSTLFTTGLNPPPAPMAAVFECPAPFIPIRAVFKSPVSVQLDPSHDSVFADALPGSCPPKANADV